ncbi:Gmad2 immunoglobulin-like domain-containing protein [Nocardioides sp.]|uniref:Gmad2 immunoglobulin-like domain-containing protein n=1 Tax=Nocardioides sp. TaxID=35761 RepID=UPI00273630A9|nr:Gmad2 immunoglobulin-like domain-containing protein [Nocardioides sp.]MDP3891100.1 Gmad2 immunoglobulin-like domain-containing protein [Nocardioides sp.]
MTTPTPDDRRLRELLSGAVDNIEPADRLATIRSRTAGPARPKGNAMSTQRSKLVGIGGAVLATAAVITGIAWAGGVFDSTPDSPGPAADPTTSVTPQEPDETEPSEPTEPPAEQFTAGVYYLGETPMGTRLYREFQRVEGATKLMAAVQAAVEGSPQDPDYSTPWPTSLTVADATEDGDVIRIELSDTADRPSGMNAEAAQLAIEQVIYTAQGAVGARTPVQFMVDGNPVSEVLGVPTSEPLAQGDPLDVLSLVSITDPSEGQRVSGGTLKVSGTANSFEANVPWQVLDGDTEVAADFFTAEGAYDKMYPFGGDIDISGLAPGEYVLRVQTDDPSSGEGPGPFVDTRTFVVE